jgi:peptide/nickel transport system ATP-binding protein
MALLKIDSLNVEYRTNRGKIRAVEDVSFSMERGQILGLAGESGSGKSTLGLSIMRLIPPPGVVTGGSIEIDGIDVMKLSENKMRLLRGSKVAYIFQDPMTSLNPVKKIGAHFVEMMQTHDPELEKQVATERTAKILKDLRIPSERIDDYPHQLSGGMRQRIMIGLAVALNPDLVIADEPTTALDVIVQAKILDLLASLRDRYGMGLILISHDLSIILERCDRIIVMYGGSMVECGSNAELHKNPIHPYTRALLRSIPNVELAEQKLTAIPGSPPNMLNPPKGCSFGPRCPHAKEQCRRKPILIDIGNGHFVRCFATGEDES